LDAVKAADEMGCKTFIGAGSQAEYGRFEGKLNASVPAFPENGYGIAKLCAGQMTRMECEKRGLRHIWTRVLSAYGPYDGSATVVVSTTVKLLRGEKPSCTAGEQMWDFLYAKDAGRAFYLLGESGIAGKTYCIGSGIARPLREYIEKIRDAVDPKASVGFGDVPYSPKQVMYLCADISELTADTGFTPEYTFEQGIRETVDWIKSGLQ
jgi:nucleoside-diphosphate-sugar epimerase